MFWFVHVLVYRRLGMLTFSFVDDLVCRRFGLSTFRFVDVLVVSISICRRLDQLPTIGSTFTQPSLVTKMIIILRKTYPNGFLQWHLFFHNFAIQEFNFLNIIYILLYTYLISSVFFLNSNSLARASHHWCLASNIILVVPRGTNSPYLSFYEFIGSGNGSGP